MTEKLCIRCGVAPVNIGPKRRESYCRDCRNARQREKAAKYRAKTGPRTCPRCQAVHTDGGSDNYCRECRRAYHRDRRRNAKTRDAINARQRAWYHANREQTREAQRDERRQIRRAAIDAYGGTCACCGEHRIEFLAIHHINGNGKQHRMQASGVGDQFFRWLKRQGWPQDVPLGVLCHNCNMSHGFYGYCPHEQERSEPDN